MLHAHRLVLKHPRTGEMLDVRTDWPKDMRRMLRDLRLKSRPAPAAPEPTLPPAGDGNADGEAA
jgi:hypothetical protein